MTSNYIKPNNFRTGAKVGAYLYIGATIASLCITPFVFTYVPYVILPFALLISHPIAWLLLGATFIATVGLLFSIIKPLFHLAKDFLHKRENKSKGYVELGTLKNKSHTPNDQSHNSISSAVDPTQYDEVYGQQDLVKQTQAGNYNYLLQQADVACLARIVQGLDSKVHEIVGSTDHLQKQLDRFKDEIEEKNNENKRLIFIVNLHNGHWVTLSVNYSNEQLSAYYYDSLNEKKNRLTFIEILKEALGINEDNIRFFDKRTQDDGSNCGIFALEAAGRINQALSKGVFNSIDEVLSKFKPTADELKKMRDQLAEILNGDEERSEFIVTSTSNTLASHNKK